MTAVNITPSPRVLRMLGQIDFAPWQCLAELIDNSIDAFIDQARAGKVAVDPRIYIKLPAESELRAGTGAIEISDTASGMSLDALMNAVKAGYSGNDPIEKMGLFGMGFNISTARMGRRTEIWTTRAEDSAWTGIVIDFDELERQSSFDVPLQTREKTPQEIDDCYHGTVVTISRLEEDRVRPLVRGQGKRKTKDRLGKIYGQVMEKIGVQILYDGDLVKAWRHCAWDKSRTVETAAFGNVPARIDIDEALEPRRFCTTCWVWLLPDDEGCSACGHSAGVIERQRRLRGWLGVQRYFDKEHYGIDLIRNGRVIEELDKSFFNYTDENGTKILEYPIDATHWGGRLIGELEIDFVRVSHQKDAFDKLDPEWRHVVDIVRGKSPMQPKIASRMQLGPNSSPLARLFTAYRKANAGLKCLVPGLPDGTGLNVGLVREYVEKFYEGEPEYQSDEKMYELVRIADGARRGGAGGSDVAGGEFVIDEPPPIESPPGAAAPPDERSGGEGAAEGRNPSGESPKPEMDGILSRQYDVSGLIHDTPPIKVMAYKHRQDIGGRPYVVKPEGYALRFDYNAVSPYFEESLITPANVMVLDLAQHFFSVTSSSIKDFPVSLICRRLQELYFPEQIANLDAMAAEASAFLDELRRHIDDNLPRIVGDDAPMVPAQEERRIAKAAALAEGATEAQVAALIRAGRYAAFCSTEMLVAIIVRYPVLVMDGQFFARPYETIAPESQALLLGEVADSLRDIVWLTSHGASAVSKDMAWRLRYQRAIASFNQMKYWQS